MFLSSSKYMIPGNVIYGETALNPDPAQREWRNERHINRVYQPLSRPNATAIKVLFTSPQLIVIPF